MCKYKCKFDERKSNSNQMWNNNKCQCKGKKHQISELLFLLITIALLTAVSIYCYLIKNRAKRKHLLSYYVINDKSVNAV